MILVILPTKKNTPVPTNGRKCGPQNQSRQCGEEKHFLPLPGIEPPLFYCLVHYTFNYPFFCTCLRMFTHNFKRGFKLFIALISMNCIFCVPSEYSEMSRMLWQDWILIFLHPVVQFPSATVFLVM